MRRQIPTGGPTNVSSSCSCVRILPSIPTYTRRSYCKQFSGSMRWRLDALCSSRRRLSDNDWSVRRPRSDKRGSRLRFLRRSRFPERLEAVLNAIYAAFGNSWEDASGADQRCRGTPSRTASTRTLAWMSGTARMHSSATARGVFEPTSSTVAAMSKWGTLGLSRHNCAGAAGGVGRLAGGLSADSAVQMVKLARQLRR